MLKNVLKNYMDSYIKFYRETFGKYPQVDAEDHPSVFSVRKMTRVIFSGNM